MKKRLIVLVVLLIVCLTALFTTIDRINEPVQALVTLSTEEVKTVQTKLKRWGYFDGPITGYYGPLTTNAVKYFQRVNGLDQTGQVGPLTSKALGMGYLYANTSTSSNSDLYLLAKCIYAEARGESYTGQVAVGAVVLNRVKSPKFPNTVSGVVYQPYAFTAVSDGQINLEPNKTSYQAAQDALNGWDPTYGSIYYYNAATATSSWIYSRPVTVVIGKHTFAI